MNLLSVALYSSTRLKTDSFPFPPKKSITSSSFPDMELKLKVCGDTACELVM
uniref:Uncharacterized protein n=1 Tax=Anguilla anguilla TaxID=7936 RepID=A0A0E9XXB8_ANGAN